MTHHEARHAEGIPGIRYAVCRAEGSETTLEVRTMAELDAQEREKLKDSEFAYIDRDGERHLPINDESHVRNAIARWNQTDFDTKTAKEEARKKILAAARRHGIEIDDDDKIARAAS